MMQTALSIIQSARYRMGLSAPSTLIGVTDPDELKMVHTLYAVCEELRQGKCWPQQKRAYSFATVSGTRTYQLPPDFYAFVLETPFNASEAEALQGPIADSAMMEQRYGGSPSSMNYAFRVVGFDQNPASAGGQFELDPTPSSIQTLRFEYITRNLFLPPHWTASTVVTTANWLNANGTIFDYTKNGTTGTTAPVAASGTITDGTAECQVSTAAYETLILDTDLCIFDADLVKLGFRAKWMEDSGGDYQAAKFEFEQKVFAAAARIRGPQRGSFVKAGFSPHYRVPSGSWSL